MAIKTKKWLKVINLAISRGKYWSKYKQTEGGNSKNVLEKFDQYFLDQRFLNHTFAPKKRLKKLRKLQPKNYKV